MDKLEAMAERTMAPLVQIGVRFGRALLANESEAENLYEKALGTDPKWPFDYARLEMSYGAWLRRQRRITDSRPHLRSARDAFEALGVQPWADKARAELRGSGERDTEPAWKARQPLTPQELQIAQWRQPAFPIVRSPTGCSFRTERWAPTCIAFSRSLGSFPGQSSLGLLHRSSRL
jgi:hypothetical protein